MSAPADSCHRRPRPNEEAGTRCAPLSRGGGFQFDGDTLRRVRHVSKRAALAGKRKIWDTNDASVTIAQTAVDQWEHAYLALRSVVIASARNASSTYCAAKTTAAGIEHNLLVPVRDLVLLPTFVGVERIVGGVARFALSEEARELAHSGIDVVRRTPLVGESILAPALVVGAECFRTAWAVAQYPIPSRSAVRNRVDGALTVTKLALWNASREVYFYMNLVDTTITRTMLHTQWRVLGSGPYFSLGSNHKLEVLDHICERYFSLSGAHPISRYELAAHIRANNPVLYNDLIMSGLLIMRAKEVGGEIKNDEWLMHLPSYRTRERPLLLSGDYLMKGEEGTAVQVLWFHLPYVNGKKPGKEVPWERFSTGDRDRLEHVFRALLQEEVIGDDVETCLSGFSDAIDELGYDFGDVMEKKSTESVHPRINDVENLQEKSSPNDAFLLQDTFLQKRPKLNQRHQYNCIGKYPTLAQWYEPDLSKDILVDERRYAVSFVPTCLSCGKDYDAIGQPIVSIENTANHICAMCRSSPQHHNFNAALIPRIKQVMRPTLWRFYGSHSNDVRRAVWVLDTHRHGLQPYSDESAAVLEDAYLFLKYNFLSPDANEEKTESSIGGVLLSVEVSGPDGEEQQLVQFRGLSHVTAIKKTLGSAFSVFKRRVYRGGSDGKELYFDCNSSEKENKNKTGAVSIVDPIFSSLAAPLDGSETGRGENYSENFDADVDHLVLVVHGMGEMLRSVDIFGMGLPALCSIVDCCSRLRNNYAEVHAAQFSDFGNINRKSPLTHEDLASSVLGRVEYIPVEWHEAFAFQSQRLPAERDLENSQKCSSATLKDISLKTIPALRDFANDTLLDVLYFMSPHHHKIITDIVAKEMHLIVKKFQELTGFDGKISILGHSLGSIITFDILANQEGQVKLDSHTPGSQQTKKVDSEYNQGYSSGYFKHKQNQNKTIEDLEYPQLKFEVQNFFMIGSPVAVFLMIRNQHMPLSEDFSLPGCSRVFNIFHPYDPAAYRIEPLIDPQNSDVEPIIITHWKGGFRVQYQTKFMLRKLADKTKKTQKDVMEAVEARMLGMGLLDSTFDDLVEEDRNGSDDNSLQVVHCGSLNHGHRIDFMLQEKEIENANEYVFALAAHSSYWNEKDLSLFVARQIFQTGNEKGEFY